jgi:hypothetical protein
LEGNQQFGEIAASLFRVEKQTKQTNMKKATDIFELISCLNITPRSPLEISKISRGTLFLRMSVTSKEIEGVMFQKIKFFIIRNILSYTAI